ncbi:ribonuclease Z [Sedimentisphaera cyanobacteriorum]|uniref:Ribonuclease Z n=1 Tax=Sedimentisphaera cyanobacteriorum TaxID=1940790 RepID=A0A1Q2HPG2_9BACT|nr:MBL fold metallo-hydrolase [Sedimentisphaera cyanobacteriorum]AQQ09337.1 ribonuclease Z [Sedimentisphaera cyanobacteriorum]
MPSHKLSTVKTDKYNIFGYSVAGEESVVAVPELGVCFDAGKAPEHIIPIDNLLLTHGHIDHSAGIAYYLSHRQFSDQTPGTVFAESSVIDKLKQLAQIWSELDGSRIEANFIKVQAGQYYPIKPRLYVVPFKTRHNRDSYGYTVVEVRQKLKEEYLGLSSPEIVELKKKGTEITYQLEIPLVSYTGDTAYSDYSSIELVRKSEVFITECTFFEHDHLERAKAGKHIHISELEDMLAPLECKTIILTHFSQRTNIGEAKSILKKTLPDEIYRKIIILMDGYRNNGYQKV